MDQYCNPLTDVSLSSISSQLDEIVEKARKMLSIKNPSHPSLSVTQGALEKAATKSWCCSASVASESLERAERRFAELCRDDLMRIFHCFGSLSTGLEATPLCVGKKSPKKNKDSRVQSSNFSISNGTHQKQSSGDYM